MKKLAVFDIDGTLIRWQLYHAVIDYLGDIGILPKNAMKEVKEARMRWKSRETSDSFHEYEMKLVKLYESSIATISTNIFDVAVNEVAKKYKSQVYVYTRSLARDLKKRGYFLIAISGSHDEIVKRVAGNYGFDYSIGSKFERVDGHFTGNIFIANANKGLVLKEIIKEKGLTLEDSYAVGDTASDVAILDMVDNPVAFNPNRELYEIAKMKRWKIIIERKNVCYELNPTDSGSYYLA